MQPRRKILSLLALAPVLGLAACGGGGGTTGTSAAPTPTSTTTTTPAATTTTTMKVVPAKPVAPAGPARKLAKGAYDARMQQLGTRLDAALAALYPLSYRPGGTAADRDTMAKLDGARRAIVRIEALLEQIVPPPPVATYHKHLEASVQELDTEIGALLASLRASDQSTFTKYASLPGLADIQKATRAMEDRGYDVIRNAD